MSNKLYSYGNRDFPICERSRVVCAANRRKDGLIICGARHWDSVMRGQKNAIGGAPEDWYDIEDGFIDQFNNFLTREEAWVIALKQRQIIRDEDKTPGTLYSENLY